MLKITRGEENELILTCVEKQTLTNPYYLIEFENDQTNQKYYAVCADTSDFKDRYQKLVITEVETSTAPSEVNLPHTGFYTYTCYEQSSSTNTDTTLATGIVEIGRAQVFGTTTTSISHTNTQTTYVYNG